VKVKINPILINIAKEFKKSHSSEPDSVAAIALMIALNWRTNKEPYLSTMSDMTGTMFDMRYDLAQKLHPFLITQGDLLGQLENQDGFFGGDYEEVLSIANNVNADYTLKSLTSMVVPENGKKDWEWRDYSWPHFTFIKITAPQAINYKILKLSQ
jgi:hypothetical protein